MTAWTREALTYETMVRQGLSSRRPLAVTDAVRSVMALQAQEPAAPYLALWNRVDGFDANDLDRALADGAIVKASLFRFTLHAVDASDVRWARAAMRSRVRDAGYHDVLDGVGLTPAYARWSCSAVRRWTLWTVRRVTCADSWPTGSPPCSPDSGGGGIGCPTVRRSRSAPDVRELEPAGAGR